MAGNVSIEQDAADNWKPSKKKSCERIDGIVALIMGLDLASREIETRSIYSTPGNLAL
jgi:phage terminase large subunit-like protein